MIPEFIATYLMFLKCGYKMNLSEHDNYCMSPIMNFDSQASTLAFTRHSARQFDYYLKQFEIKQETK
jgi:hypothetical protein